MSEENQNLDELHELEFAEEGEGSAAAEELSADSGTNEAAAVSEEASEEASEETSEVIEKEFLAPEQVESIIETILFVSDRPVGLAAIRSAFKGTTAKKDQILDAIERLTTEYAGGRRGISLETVAGGYQLRTKIDNGKYLRSMGKTKSFKLSGPSLETLAIIAYKQPLTKAEVDHIRGVESGHLVRALMDRGLVSFDGKSEAPGKPMQYGTTKKFLEIFGLRNPKELPSLSEIDELIPQGIDEAEGEKLQINQLAEKLGDSAISNYSIGEEELLEISDELTKISSSTDFFEEEKRRQREKRDRERAEDIKQALTFGEEVAQTDVKWLQKYEANQAAAAVSAAAAAASLASAELSAPALAQVEEVKSIDEVALNEEPELSVETVITEELDLTEEPKPTDG